MPADNMSSIGPQADVNSRIAALDAEKARLKLLDAQAKNEEKLMKLRSDLSIKEAKVNQGLDLERSREQFFQQDYFNRQANAFAEADREDTQAFAAEQGAASRAFQSSEAATAREAQRQFAVEDREDQQKFAAEEAEKIRQNVIEMEDRAAEKELQRLENEAQDLASTLKAMKPEEAKVSDIDARREEVDAKTQVLRAKLNQAKKDNQESLAQIRSGISNIADDSRIARDAASKVSEAVVAGISSVAAGSSNIIGELGKGKVRASRGQPFSVPTKEEQNQVTQAYVTDIGISVQNTLRSQGIDSPGIGSKVSTILNEMITATELSNLDEEASVRHMQTALDTIKEIKGELPEAVVDGVLTGIYGSLESYKEGLERNPGTNKPEDSELFVRMGTKETIEPVMRAMEKLVMDRYVDRTIVLVDVTADDVESALLSEDPAAAVTALFKDYEGSITPLLEHHIESFTKNLGVMDEFDRKILQNEALIQKMEFDIKTLRETNEDTFTLKLLERRVQSYRDERDRLNEERSNQRD
jgi:hypothetical protein